MLELVRENGRDARKLERLSMRKQLKLKCQEQYLPAPGHDKALLTVGANAVLCQSRPSASHGQTSKKPIYLLFLLLSATFKVEKEEVHTHTNESCPMPNEMFLTCGCKLAQCN